VKIVIYEFDSEYHFDDATPEDIAAGDFYEVSEDMYNQFMDAQALWTQAQIDATRWVHEHPNEAVEPEPEEGGIEPIFTNEFEG